MGVHYIKEPEAWSQKYNFCLPVKVNSLNCHIKEREHNGVRMYLGNRNKICGAGEKTVADSNQPKGGGVSSTDSRDDIIRNFTTVCRDAKHPILIHSPRPGALWPLP